MDIRKVIKGEVGNERLALINIYVITRNMAIVDYETLIKLDQSFI